MKEDMYTYHYYKKRSILKPSRTSEFIFEGIVVSGIAFVLMIVFQTVK